MKAHKTQFQIAERLGLPTRFSQGGDAKNAGGNAVLRRSAFPETLAPGNFEAATPAQLDAFTEYSVKEHSGENMIFLMALGKLESAASDDPARRTLATNMQRAFTGEDPELQPNLDSKNKTQLEAALVEVAAGRTPGNFNTVIENARRNILQSVGADSYRRFLAKLPD